MINSYRDIILTVDGGAENSPFILVVFIKQFFFFLSQFRYVIVNNTIIYWVILMCTTRLNEITPANNYNIPENTKRKKERNRT